MKRSLGSLLIAGLCLVAASGCNRFESPRDHWYRDVKAGTLQPIPFSHDLELAGYIGWQFLGKLPASLAAADAVEYTVRVGEESLTDEIEESPEFTARWEPDADGPRRIDVDLLILRVLEDGQPVYRYRAVINGSEISQVFAAPEGYRHELRISPPPDPAAIRPGAPIPLGSATITSWSREDSERVNYNLLSRTYHWQLRFDPVIGGKD